MSKLSKGKWLALVLAVAMVLMLVPMIAAADNNNNNDCVTLYAGQDIPVGEVCVSNDGENLHVEYKITEDGWCITETHLHVGKNLGDFPLAGRWGNPVPGRFDYSEDHDPCVTEYEYIIPLGDWEAGDELIIAAHAVVVNPTQLDEGEELFYLSSSRPRDEIGGEERPGSEVFIVEFDDEAKEGNLTLLITLPDDNFGQVDAMAATPDGDYLYFYDKESDHLGRFPVDGDPDTDFEDLGEVASAPSGEGVVLATFSPDGTLYVACQVNNSVYTVDTETPEASILGDTGINVSGADMAFDAEGVLYLYSNAMNALHTINLATGAATEVGSGLDNLTGIAFREGGLTDLVGSLSGFPNGVLGEFVLFDREASELDKYPMLLNGEQIIYTSGDMATGFIGEPWEETAWADGTRFTERGNWATYFSYTMEEYLELVDEFTVDSSDMDGTDSTISLVEGVDYRIKVDGTWSNKPSNPHMVDAKYISFDNWETYLEGYPDRDTTLLQLMVDGEFVNWGDFNPDHIYYWDLEGKGETVNLAVYDTYYGDNVGSFDVEIYRVW